MSAAGEGRVRRHAQVWLRELGGEPAVVTLGATAFLMLAHYQGSTNFFRRTFGPAVSGHALESILPYFWWFLSAVVFYLAMPLLLSAATRGSFTRNYGLGLGDWRAGCKLTLLLLAVMLPVVYLAAQTPMFSQHYPLAGRAAYTLSLKPEPMRVLWLFVAYEAAYCAYFICWEFLFRGWMLHGVLREWGRGPAILVQMVPFALMHLGKPEPEALGSIVAGIALGVLALRTRSFWYGAFLHGAVAVWMDVLAAFPYLLGA